MMLPNGKADDLIKDADMSTFMADVVEESNNQPVLVDFWADWCGPCKALTPILEKAVREAGGAVKLVKVNADENQDLAAQLRIQSLPTILAFKDGQPIDGFAGALPESEVKAFIARLGGDAHEPNIADFLKKAEDLYNEGEVEAALELYGHIGQADPSNIEAVGGLARCFLKLGQADKAGDILKMVPEDKHGHPALAGVFAALDLAAKAPAGDALIELRQKVERNPADNQASYDLAEGLFAAGEREEAAATLLGLIKKDRKWNDEAARKLLLKMFEAAGPSDPFTIETRKRLSSILFS